jgi:hypothetical protein
MCYWKWLTARFTEITCKQQYNSRSSVVSWFAAELRALSCVLYTVHFRNHMVFYNMDTRGTRKMRQGSESTAERIED